MIGPASCPVNWFGCRASAQAALGCGANHLLTGDLEHLGPFMNRPEDTSGVHIQTVAEFLESLSA